MKYRLKVTEVDAVFWDGVNREPVYEALENALRFAILKEIEYAERDGGTSPAHVSDWRELVRFTADEESGEQYDNYNLLRLWHVGCGGPEVSPGDWLAWVWDDLLGDFMFVGMDDAGFRSAYEVPE